MSVLRRKEREVTNLEEILGIIRRCEVMRIGLWDEKTPYIVPMNFGVEEKNGEIALYFHCANEGKKLELIKKNPNAGFECDRMGEMKTAPAGCAYSLKSFESVMGAGIIEILPEDEKRHAFEVLLSQYTEEVPPLDENIMKKTCALKLTVESISGKRKS